MIEGAELIYQEIAEAIEDAIPEEWTSATMQAIFYPGSSTFFGEYSRTVDGKLRDFATSSVGENAFERLRNQFKVAGKPLWGQATFEMSSDGKFNIRFGYENCDVNGDTIFDEELELKRDDERFKRLSGG